MLSLMLFMSLASFANSGTSNSGDLTKSGTKSLAISDASDMDYNYLRFDVNKYSSENEEADLINSSLDYLRFDVNNFISENETEVLELPAANEFESLRFDVNNFTEINPDNTIELPVNEFAYLHFDVNNFTTPGIGIIDELPETE